jgi:hypothetical protein
MSTKSFPKVGYLSGDGINNMGNFITDNKFDILQNNVKKILLQQFNHLETGHL